MNSQTHHHQQPLNDPPPMHMHMQAIPPLNQVLEN